MAWQGLPDAVGRVVEGLTVQALQLRKLRRSSEVALRCNRWGAR